MKIYLVYVAYDHGYCIENKGYYLHKEQAEKIRQKFVNQIENRFNDEACIAELEVDESI